MVSGSPDRTGRGGAVMWLRRHVDSSTVGMLFVGVLAGVSLAVLGDDAVVVPLVGGVPGVVAGFVGLTASALAFRRVGCCGGCGCVDVGPASRCGCSDD